MKKIIFIICVSLFMVNAFATDSDANTFTTDTEIEYMEESNIALVANYSEDPPATMCCRRTVRNAEGESWSARRCVTHEDSHIAMGRACEMAQADANDARDRAHSLTVTQN